MLNRALSTFCLSVIGSPVTGWAVRTITRSASRPGQPRARSDRRRI